MVRILAVVALFFVQHAFGVEYSPTATWEHDCLDIEGNPEELREWRGRWLDGTGAEISAEVLPDATCELRSWAMAPINIEYGSEYTLELRAVDQAGNASAPGIATLTIEDTTAPSTPKVINVEVNCPAGYTCNVVVNGEGQ